MGRDKATLTVPGRTGGTTLVEHTVATLGDRCSPIFVVAAPGQALPALNAVVLRDDVRGVGPLLATARGLRAAADAGRQRAGEASESLRACVSDRPFTCIGAAFGAGLIAGWLVRR